MTDQHTNALDEATIRSKAEQIWRDVLNDDRSRPEATFFELRGQSITAVQMVTRLEEELGVWIDVGDLFEDPTLDSFVRDVVTKAAAARQGK
ncbi:phosphopantetheine-binding protein [Micromonospora sediminicola]|uniref:phosphopantetheine-binding protein n=1 Tax=Micromonospora sediminicola TaxID=946078 RepID=UPI0033C751A0